jgi:hypothetical protein
VKQKPSKEYLSQLFKLMESLNRYVSVDKVFILGETVFLSRGGQPDIITSVPYDEDKLLEALQSIGFLTTMKKDPKVIDLRYKNPIIR